MTENTGNTELSKKIISKIINFLYSEDKKIERWLLLLIIIGFVLRLIAALNLGLLADDAVKAYYSAGIIASKTLSTNSHPALFYYLTDFAYKILGYTTLASRFWPVIFGTLLIPLVFLITRRFFNEKVALAAAFFATFSNFLIRTTFTEETLVILFFVVFGTYLGLEYLHTKKFYFFFLSAILFGLAALTKYSAPFFILSFLIFSAYYLKANNEKIFTKKNIKLLILFLFIIFFFSLPFLTFNYLLYKDKGIVDIYFSRIIKLNSTQQLYGSLAGQGQSYFDNIKELSYYGNITLPFKNDFILAFFALFGLFLLFIRKQKLPLVFIILFFMIPFLLQTPGSPLAKHFAFMYFFLSIPAGFGLVNTLEKIDKKKWQKILCLILLVLLVINIGTQSATPSNYFSTNENPQIKSFISSNVNEDDLIIFDTRIYGGRYFWLGTPDHFLNLHQFVNFYNENKDLHDKGINTNVYIIECLTDDCGIGVPNAEINQSSEAILQFFRENSQPVKTVKSMDYKGWNELFGNKEKTPKYQIYFMNIKLDSVLIKQIDYMNSFYFVPYLYKNRQDYIFDYNTYSVYDILLNKLSYYIIILSMILSLLTIFLVIFFLRRTNK